MGAVGQGYRYPGFDGLTIVDLPSFRKRSFEIPGITAQQWGSGPEVHWIDEQTLVLITLEGQFFTMDALSGKLLQQLTFNAYAATRVPDSRDLALFTWGGMDVSLERIDPLTGAVRTIAALPARRGIGPLPLVTFSGDGARLCVTYADPEPLPTCGDAGDPLAALPSKLTIEVGILGADRLDRFWQPLSPDLTRVAAVDGQGGDLTVSLLDGSDPISIGRTPGPLTYEWRPDGVLRRRTGP